MRPYASIGEIDAIVSGALVHPAFQFRRFLVLAFCLVIRHSDTWRACFYTLLANIEHRPHFSALFGNLGRLRNGLGWAIKAELLPGRMRADQDAILRNPQTHPRAAHFMAEL